MSIEHMKIMQTAEMRLLRLAAGYRTVGQKRKKGETTDANIVLKAIQ
jgi:hypothetical protein